MNSRGNRLPEGTKAGISPSALALCAGCAGLLIGFAAGFAGGQLSAASSAQDGAAAAPSLPDSGRVAGGSLTGNAVEPLQVAVPSAADSSGAQSTVSAPNETPTPHPGETIGPLRAVSSSATLVAHPRDPAAAKGPAVPADSAAAAPGGGPEGE